MINAFEINPTSFPAAKIVNIGQVVNLVLPLALTGAGLIFLAVLLFAAFNILTHGDNPEALKKAYGSIATAVMGLFIVIISYLVVRLLGVIPK